MSEPDYGKRSTIESYFKGELKSVKTEYTIPVLIKERKEALNEIMKCLELIDTRQTTNLTILVQADTKTHDIKLITKSYIIENK